MSFAWPWLALLLPLPALLPKHASGLLSQQSLDHPYLAALSEQGGVAQPSRWSQLLQWLVWALLLLAAMRPQWVGEPIFDQQRGRALYLAVDLSESMLERDMRWHGQPIERYQAVQAVVSEFVSKRAGDFLGLVVFGEFAEVQAPLTPDTAAISGLLADLRPGMAGGKTAIGDGLALSAKQLREADSEERVIILLSDGANNSGQVTPEEAISVALQSNIRVYTIGFGSDRGQSLFGRLNLGSGSLDEQTLKRIAASTDGQYFRASSATELIEVFRNIDRLEPNEVDDQPQRRVSEWYWLPLAAALLLLLLQMGVRQFLAWRAA